MRRHLLAVLGWYTSPAPLRWTIWPFALLVTALLILLLVVPPPRQGLPGAIVCSLFLLPLLPWLFGFLCRLQIDEGRRLLLPGAQSSQLLVCLLLILAFPLALALVVGLRMGLNPATAVLGLLALTMLSVQAGWLFVDWAISINLHPRRTWQVLLASAIVPLCALAPVRDGIAGLFMQHPAWSPWQRLLLDAVFLIFCLALPMSLRRSYARTLAAEVAHPNMGRNELGPITALAVEPPVIPRLPQQHLSTRLAQLRHCSAGLFASPNLPGLALLQVAIGLGLLAFLHSRPGLEGRLAPMLAGETLLLQVLANGDFMLTAPHLRQDAMRPWTRRYWAWLILATMLWRKLSLLSTLWAACLVPWFFSHQGPGMWAPWILASYLVQPLLMASQSWQLSLRQQQGLVVGLLHMGVIMFFGTMGLGQILEHPHTLFGIPPLHWLLTLALLAVADVVAIALAHRRWVRMDLRI